MKKLIILIIILMPLFIFNSCSKKDETKDVKKEEAFKDFKYEKAFYVDDRSTNNILVNTKDTMPIVKVEMYIWGDYNTIYKTNYDFKKFLDKYPMYEYSDTFAHERRAELLLNKTYTVCVTGFFKSTDLELKDYGNADTVKKILAMFDLEGILKLPTDKKITDSLTGKDFIKFMPKFEILPNK